MSEPKNTIYINNLPEKLKIEELKKALKAVFSQFGEIVEIIAAKNLKMHGQAFVAFKEQGSATVALKSMNGFPFYDKPMKIQYAKQEADCIAKLNGTYKERPKVVRSDLRDHLKKKVSAKTAVQCVVIPSVTSEVKAVIQPGILPGVTSGGMVPCIVPNVLSTNPVPMAIPMNSEPPPHHILFVTNLPKEANEMMLTVLFNGFPGFKEVRLVPGRPDIAFIEFETAVAATAAKAPLQGFRLTPTNPINISFAKK